MEYFQNLLRIIGRQLLGILEIIQLKLKILGFSNKRSGLNTKLGEVAFKAIKESRELAEDADAKNLVSEIDNAGYEISEAEEAIIKRKEADNKDFKEFKEKNKRSVENETPYKSDVKKDEKPADSSRKVASETSPGEDDIKGAESDETGEAKVMEDKAGKNDLDEPRTRTPGNV